MPPTEGSITVRAIVAIWTSIPFVPETVIVEVPVGVAKDVVTVMVEVEVAGLGLKVAPAPAGSPPALSWTAPLNVLLGAIATVYVVLLPCATFWIDGLTESEKSGVTQLAN